MKKKVIIALGTILVVAVGLIFITAKNKNQSVSWQEGTYLKAKSADMVIFGNEPCAIHNETGKDDAFSGLKTGDTIKVKCGPILESYPGQVSVMKVKFVKSGTISNISENVITSLKELGWIE